MYLHVHSLPVPLGRLAATQNPVDNDYPSAFEQRFLFKEVMYETAKSKRL